jgi:hypothetical protein
MLLPLLVTTITSCWSQNVTREALRVHPHQNVLAIINITLPIIGYVIDNW